jgi:hypothetical protein
MTALVEAMLDSQKAKRRNQQRGKGSLSSWRADLPSGRWLDRWQVWQISYDHLFFSD